jgi:hypothetical protein
MHDDADVRWLLPDASTPIIGDDLVPAGVSERYPARL